MGRAGRTHRGRGRLRRRRARSVPADGRARTRARRRRACCRRPGDPLGGGRVRRDCRGMDAVPRPGPRAGGLSEIARVLRPGGALVAVTNGARDLHEVWDLVGRDLEPRRRTFRKENGEQQLRRHFESVRRIDVVGQVRFPDADAIRRYADRPPSAGASSTGSPTRRHLSWRRRSSACSRRPPRPAAAQSASPCARHSGPACGRRQAREQVADCNLLSCAPTACVSAAAWARHTAGVVDQVEQIARRTSAEIDLEEELRRHAAALASLAGGMDENTDLLVRRSCDPDALAITTGRSHDIGDDGGPRLEPPDETHDADIDDRSGPDHDRTLAEPLSRDRVAAEPGW
jgi:hypothetical protein